MQSERSNPQYRHLSAEDRAALMLMHGDGHSLRRIAARLGRAPSTLSRELLRGASGGRYDATFSGERAARLRRRPRRQAKLRPGTTAFAVVEHWLRAGWSPEQIAGRLKRMHPDDPAQRVSHETIYNALYVLARGELRRALLACLRQGRTSRRPRARGVDRRGQIPDLVEIHVRPPEVEDRLIPGHWEGDLIKGTANRSSIGTLVERTSRLVLLVPMANATAQAALEGFSQALNRVPAPMRKTLTYDRGKEMSAHGQLRERTGVAVYFADPHSPWQRGSNENTNGLLRQYLPKGTDLSVHSYEDLEAIAYRLNSRPRKVLGFQTPLEVYAQLLIAAVHSESEGTATTVALGP